MDERDKKKVAAIGIVGGIILLLLLRKRLSAVPPPLPPPGVPVTLQIWANYNSGGLLGANASKGPLYTYHDAWSSPTAGMAGTGAPSISTGHEHYPNLYWSGEGWWLRRCFIYFDTSMIPNDPRVIFTKAELHLYGNIDDNSDRDWDLVIQNGQPTYPHHPVENGDWYTGHYGDVGGFVNKSLVNGYFCIPLNALGASWINKGGETKLGLRVSREINEDPPPLIDAVTVYERCTLISYFFPNDPTKSPYLLLTYETLPGG
jgi:hypothetical protein